MRFVARRLSIATIPFAEMMLPASMRREAQAIDAAYGAQTAGFRQSEAAIRAEREKSDAARELVIEQLGVQLSGSIAQCKELTGELTFRCAWELALTKVFYIACAHKDDAKWQSTACFPGNTMRFNATGVEQWLVKLRSSGMCDQLGDVVQCLCDCVVDGLFGVLSSSHHGKPLNLATLVDPANKGALSVEQHEAICCGLRCLGLQF